ncbi:hypothetical protein OAB57_03000 [Bacteriovoracaceae bacterium]|nr:hypothetical protein [Bacteriovoracaceae bacterium]
MKASNLRKQFILIQGIRDFFTKREYIDVLTPPIVENPGFETHIHPFNVQKTHLPHKSPPLPPSYLHTSPEFHMKELLSLGFEKIFTICYCFRDEPKSPIHRQQFVMLEWYHANTRYENIIIDIKELIIFLTNFLIKKNIIESPPPFLQHFTQLTVQELFSRTLGIDILEYLEKQSLRNLIKSKFPDVPIPDNCTTLNWDDYYFLLFLNKVEPQLIKYPYLVLYEYPSPLAALSTISRSNPKVAERFELYVNGIEIANCFNELTSITEQKKRFHEQNKDKQSLYRYSLPQPNILFNALERSIPKSSGIALGIERLLTCFIGNNKDPFYSDQ